jgi:predicted Zn-dependent peptidase
VRPCRFLFVAVAAALAVPLRAAPLMRTLPNGMRVVVSAEAGTGRAAAVLMVRGGDADDPRGADGGVRVLGRLLMQPVNHGAAARWDETAINGATWVATEPDVTAFSAVTTPDGLDAAIRRLSLVIGEPIWNRTLVMRSVREEGEADREEPPDDWRKDFDAWQSRAGLPAPPPLDPRPPDRETLRRLYNLLYTPDRMTLAVVGDISPEAVLAAAARAFTAPASPAARLVSRRARSVVSEPGKPSGNYAFVGVTAPPATAPDAPAVEVLAAALGQGKSSGLFQQLREKEGTGYESGVIYPRRLTDSGLALYALAPDRADAMRDDLLGVWRAAGTAPEGGWDSARARAAHAYAVQHQTARDRAYWLAFWETGGQGASHDAEFMTRLRTVPDAALATAAKRYLAAPPVSVP